MCNLVKRTWSLQRATVPPQPLSLGHQALLLGGKQIPINLKDLTPHRYTDSSANPPPLG